MGDTRCNVWEISTLHTRYDLNHYYIGPTSQIDRHTTALTSEAEGARNELIQLFRSF
jgi:hypothetical protein